MQNIVYTVVFDSNAKHILVCKNAVSGMLSFVCGICRNDEIAYDAAYRSLYEIGGIVGDDIILNPLFSITDGQRNDCIDIWFGKLQDDIGIVCADVQLVWYSLNADLSAETFDGDGLAEYIINRARKAFNDGTC